MDTEEYEILTELVYFTDISKCYTFPLNHEHRQTYLVYAYPMQTFPLNQENIGK